VHGDRSAYMKIAVGIMDFLSPPPRNTDNASGPAQRKRSREDTNPAPGRVFHSREGRTSVPDLPTAAIPAGPAAVAEGEVVAVAAASTKRHSSRWPAVLRAQPDDLRIINNPAHICTVF